jgi:hypothetical protein
MRVTSLNEIPFITFQYLFNFLQYLSIYTISVLTQSLPNWICENRWQRRSNSDATYNVLITQSYNTTMTLCFHQPLTYIKWRIYSESQQEDNSFVYSVAEDHSHFFVCSSSHVSGEYYYHKSYFMRAVYIVELQPGSRNWGVRLNQQGTGFCLWFWYMLYCGKTVSRSNEVILPPDGNVWQLSLVLLENCEQVIVLLYRVVFM